MLNYTCLCIVHPPSYYHTPFIIRHLYKYTLAHCPPSTYHFSERVFLVFQVKLYVRIKIQNFNNKISHNYITCVQLRCSYSCIPYPIDWLTQSRKILSSKFYMLFFKSLLFFSELKNVYKYFTTLIILISSMWFLNYYPSSVIVGPCRLEISPINYILITIVCIVSKIYTKWVKFLQ